MIVTLGRYSMQYINAEMMYSYQIEKAIRAAGVLHKDRIRKGRIPYPYVTHPFSVACIIADYTDDEHIIIAGLLHDTIEEAGYTFAELKEDFGEIVCSIVKDITISSDEEHTRETWKERHASSVARLKRAREEALIVSAADKIHDMRSIIEEYYGDHARFRRDFGGSTEERVTIYQSISNILNSRLSNPIVHEFNHVFDEYKKFIYEAENRNA